MVSCEQCGASFPFPRRNRSKKNPGRFCSRPCKDAHQIGQRPAAWDYFATPESTPAERVRAAGLVYMRIRRGTLERPKACQKCGKVGRDDGHHPDYQQPALVAFLCRSCHMKAHHNPDFEREVAQLVQLVPQRPRHPTTTEQP